MNHVCFSNLTPRNTFSIATFKISGINEPFLSFEANPTTPQYGKDPVIKLPFNWGTNPDRAYTEDGEPYTVRPLNSFLSINATENRISRSSPLITKLKRRGIDVAIKDLAMDFIKSFHVKDSDKNLLFSPLRYALKIL